MLNILKELRETQELAEFYTNGETEIFEVGNIVALNDKIFAFRSFSSNGDQTGIVAYSVEDIFQVLTNTKYIEKIKKLCTDNSYSDISNEIDESNIMLSILNIALNRKEVISVKLMGNNDYNFIGFVESIDDNEFKIKLLDEYGYEDGFGYASIKDITELVYMTEKERRHFRLWQFNQQNEKKFEVS